MGKQFLCVKFLRFLRWCGSAWEVLRAVSRAS